MTDSRASGSPGTSLGPPWDRALEWIETRLEGRVTSVERQPRWRPAFFIDLDRGGERLSLYFRGARPDFPDGARALEHEMGVLQLLEDEGIPVPHVHGLCPDPPGIVMTRCDGRENLATATSETERRAVLDEYMEILARIHALDVSPFEKRGMHRPSEGRELGLCDLARWEGTFRKSRRTPEPLIEFVLGWLRRNVPHERSRASLVLADSGQFLFREGRITALLDLELACLGDPAADLAGMRGRDLSEPLGDLRPAFERYFALAGEVIPTPVIDYHTIRFNLYTPMAVAPLVAAPPPGIDIVQYLGWYWVWSRACLEVMAHGAGVELEPASPPDAAPTRYSRTHDALTATLCAGQRDGDFAVYELDAAARSAEYLARAGRFGPEIEHREREATGALVGRPVRSWQESDAALEAFVLAAGPERDAELIQHLHRRALDNEFLLEPVLRELQGASIQLLD